MIFIPYRLQNLDSTSPNNRGNNCSEQEPRGMLPSNETKKSNNLLLPHSTMGAIRQDNLPQSSQNFN